MKKVTIDKHEDIRSIDESDEMREMFSKLIKASGEMASVSKELQKKPVKSLDIIDYDYLGLDKSKYDSKEEKDLNVHKSMYALLKYINEHPTPWVYDYYLESIDRDALDWLIEKEYIDKVMPEEFPQLLKDYTVEELIRESESSHDPGTTKEDMIKYFMDWCDWSWIVSEKGLEYLNAHPFLDFFANNLLDFNIYEFKLFVDKYKNDLSLEEISDNLALEEVDDKGALEEMDDKLALEEIGDKYINAKLEKALSNHELDLYLNYVDYYFNLYLSKKDYENALVYLIQRIIYEVNIWHLKEYHVAFDEAFSIKTDYLLFKITKLNLDFDLESIYDEAYNSLKIDEIKFKYDENYDIVKMLMAGVNIYDISSDLLDEAKAQGKFKSFF